MQESSWPLMAVASYLDRIGRIILSRSTSVKIVEGESM